MKLTEKNQKHILRALIRVAKFGDQWTDGSPVREGYEQYLCALYEADLMNFDQMELLNAAMKKALECFESKTERPRWEMEGRNVFDLLAFFDTDPFWQTAIKGGRK